MALLAIDDPLISGLRSACQQLASGSRNAGSRNSDCVLDSRRALGKLCTARLAIRLVSRLASRLKGGFNNRLRRNVFTDTETAAKKGNVAFGIDGFVGDKHLRTAIGALHIKIPELVRRSIAICHQITIYCGIKYVYIQYVVVVSISQGCDFLYLGSEAYTTKLTNHIIFLV